MKAIVDSSPLISLAVLDQLELLDLLFSQIIVPSAVYLEIEGSKDKEDVFIIENYILDKIRHIENKQPKDFGLGKGETEAINLCLELSVDLLIIDDKKARNSAESCNIKCIGTLGVLTLAKKKGYIPELRRYFHQLIKNERYFSLGLLNQILRANKESPLKS